MKTARDFGNLTETDVIKPEAKCSFGNKTTRSRKAVGPDFGETA